MTNIEVVEAMPIHTIGGFDQDGKPSGWVFGTGPEDFTVDDRGPRVWGGHTIDYLLDIYRDHVEKTEESIRERSKWFITPEQRDDGSWQSFVFNGYQNSMGRQTRLGFVDGPDVETLEQRAAQLVNGLERR